MSQMNEIQIDVDREDYFLQENAWSIGLKTIISKLLLNIDNNKTGRYFAEVACHLFYAQVQH